MGLTSSTTTKYDTNEFATLTPSSFPTCTLTRIEFPKNSIIPQDQCTFVVAAHPQVENFIYLFVDQSKHNRILSLYKISIAATTLANYAIQYEQLILSKEYSPPYGPSPPSFMSCMRAIDNGFETVTVVNNFMARVQWLFDGTEKVISSAHGYKTCVNPHAIVNDCCVMIASQYPTNKTTLECWDLNKDTFASQSISSFGSVLPYDEHRVLVLQGYTAAAYLFDTKTKKMQPHPLFKCMGNSAFSAQLNSNYMVLFSDTYLVLLNKTTRESKVFNTNNGGLISGVALPKLKELNGGADMLIGANHGLYTVSFSASDIDEGYPAMPTDAVIETAQGSIPVHKHILAARIPKAIQDVTLLDWKFATKQTAQKVVRFLYSGDVDIDATTTSAEMNQILEIADRVELPILQQFVQSIQSGNDNLVNIALNQIAIEKKLPYYSTIDNISFDHVFHAFLALCENKDGSKRAQLALEENPDNLLIERFVKSIERSNTNNLIRSYGNLERDLIKLVNNPFLADMEFKMGNTTIVAHAVYFKESPFIATMRELTDDKKLVINMDTLGLACDEDILKKFLIYVYTGTVSLPTDLNVQSMTSVARLAHFFTYVELKNHAEQWLCNNVTKNNAGELCEFASLNQCSKLLQSVQQHLQGSIATIDNLVFQLSDVTNIGDNNERTLAITKDFTMMGTAHLSESLQFIIVPSAVNTNGLAMFNTTLPIAHGFEISMTIAAPVAPFDYTTLRCSIVADVPKASNQVNNIFTCSLRQMKNLIFECPMIHCMSEQTLTFPLQLTMTCIPMKHLDAARNDQLLLVTVNNVTHSFVVQFDANQQYFFAMHGANENSSSSAIHVQAFKAEYTSNEAAWLPAIMNKPITCFRAKCNQEFTLATNTDTSCVAHGAYAGLVDPYSARADFDFSECDKLWTCCNGAYSSAGCYTGKHGLVAANKL